MKMTQKHEINSNYGRPTFITMHKLSKLSDTATKPYTDEPNIRHFDELSDNERQCRRLFNLDCYAAKVTQKYSSLDAECENPLYSTAVSCAPRFICTYSTLSNSIPSCNQNAPSIQYQKIEGAHKKMSREGTREIIFPKPNAHSTMCINTMSNSINSVVNMARCMDKSKQLSPPSSLNFQSYPTAVPFMARNQSNLCHHRRYAWSLEDSLKKKVNDFSIHSKNIRQQPETLGLTVDDHNVLNKRSSQCTITYMNDSCENRETASSSRRHSFMSENVRPKGTNPRDNHIISTDYIDHRKNQLNRNDQTKNRKKEISRIRSETELKKLYDSGLLSTVLEKASYFEDVDIERFKRKRTKLPGFDMKTEDVSNAARFEKQIFWNGPLKSSMHMRQKESPKTYKVTERSTDVHEAARKSEKSRYSHVDNVRAFFESKSAQTKGFSSSSSQQQLSSNHEAYKKTQSDDEELRRRQRFFDDENSLTFETKQSREYRNITPHKALRVQLGAIKSNDRKKPSEIKKGIQESCNVLPVKEGVLYCKMVKEDGKKALDRSWRGAWAVLHCKSLYLCKEKKDGILIPLNADLFPINLKAIQVSPADDYTKKQRVFRIVTTSGTEVLFQAADIQSLCEWVHEIRKCAVSESRIDLPVLNEPLHRNEISPNKRTSLSHSKFKRSIYRKDSKTNLSEAAQKRNRETGKQTGSSDDPGSSNRHKENFVRSFVRRGLRGILSTGINDAIEITDLVKTNSCEHMNFGIRLELCESSSISEYVPIVVEILSKLIELRGITYIGLYRQTGSIQTTNWLISQLDRGVKETNFNDERWYDVKAVASALKTFFARLPECLFGDKFYAVLMDASRIEEHSVRLKEIRTLLHQLSPHRFETLKFLTKHFRTVASYCFRNKIDARNIAIIFGPTLLWYKKRSIAENLTDNPEKIRLLESLIYYHSWFFDGSLEKKIPDEVNPELPDIISEECEVNDNIEPPSAIALRIVNAATDRWGNLKRDSLEFSPDAHSPTRLSVSVKRCSNANHLGQTSLPKYPQTTISLIEYCGKVDDNPKTLPFQNFISFKSSKKVPSNNYFTHPMKRNALSFKLRKNSSPIKLARRHTFSTILEFIANGAKAGSKWWTQMNFFPVPPC